MSSRPGIGTQPPSQRTTSGCDARTQARPRPAQTNTQIQTRQPEAVTDPTVDEDEDGLVVETLPAAPETKPAAGSTDNASTIANGTTNAQRGPYLNLVRGKPQLFFDNGSPSRTSVPDAGASTSTTEGTQRLPLQPTSSAIPFPPRPGIHVREGTAQARLVGTHGVGRARRDTVVGAQGPEVPSAAADFPDGRPTDFFPWNGNHPEDVMSEQVVKSGFYDKSQVVNETNTARVSLWPTLKNKSGLQSLSSLFVSVLEKRQTLRRLTTTSAFKLPPRVALTDAKREEWLRDLANPTVPLRRLSRKIPHGIRGRGLLDQCLSKNIPTARAVWVAKCVGANEMANELRAIKRKGNSGSTGMSGEQKWVREWTLHVEQFVESTSSGCGQQDWKVKMDYAVRLASHIYAEHLLDRDHYLDWVVAQLESCQLERLPIWLLLTQIYWKDFVAERKRGRRVAESLLAQAAAVTVQAGSQLLAPVVRRLHQLIIVLAVSHYGCMILPRTWSKYKQTLHDLASNSQDPLVATPIGNVVARNERIASAGCNPCHSQKSPQRQLLALLDSVRLEINLEQLSSKCLALVADTEGLVDVVIQWATSVYREGQHRIYLVTRLLRRWNRTGMDTDGAILALLPRIQVVGSLEQRSVYRIIAELVSSKHFSVGRYLQWLISSGTLALCGRPDQSDACHIRLLAELPSGGLPKHILNLKQTLHCSVGVSVDAEKTELLAAKCAIAQQLPDIVQFDESATATNIDRLADLSTGARSEISRWLRQRVASYTTTAKAQQPKETATREAEISAVMPQQFYAIREILEQLQDFPILADILQIVSSSMDATILAAIADTINYHCRVFAAIGAATPLFNLIVERYQTLRLQAPPERSFSLALTDLCCTIRGDPRILQQFKLDLARLEQQQAAAAVCSPASDNMEALHSSSIDSDDDIDRVLASGTNMDEQMLNRVFQRVVARIEKSADEAQSSRLANWFYRLKTFDDKCFDRLMLSWLSNLIMRGDESHVSLALPSLVASRCLTLNNFLQVSEKCLADVSNKDQGLVVRISLLLLNALLHTGATMKSCQPQDDYRYRLEQQRFCREHRVDVLRLIRTAIDRCLSTAGADLTAHLQAILSNEGVLSVVKEYAIDDIEQLSDCLALNSPHANAVDASLLKRLLDQLLDPTGSFGISLVPHEARVRKIVELADDLSLPFCQLELRYTLSSSGHNSDNTKDGSAAALFGAINTALEGDRLTWTELISGLGASTTCQIRQHAERHVFSAALRLVKRSQSHSHETPDSGDEHLLSKYLAVVDATAWSLTDSGESQVAVPIYNGLRTLAELLTSVADEARKPSSAAGPSASSPLAPRTICPWIDAFLHLSVIHKRSILSSKSNPDQASFLSLLCSLLLHPELQAFPAVTDYIFDVAACFSDEVPDTVRIHLARSEVLKTHSNPRIAFLFGSVAAPDSWLGLVKGRVATAQQPRGTAQQGMARQQQQQQQQQNQMGGRVPPAQNMTRPPSQQMQQQSVRQDSKPVPFPLRRWEILPDAGSNDTALSLTLFGARKV